jgi:hypothetical protein
MWRKCFNPHANTKLKKKGSVRPLGIFGRSRSLGNSSRSRGSSIQSRGWCICPAGDMDCTVVIVNAKKVAPLEEQELCSQQKGGKSVQMFSWYHDDMVLDIVTYVRYYII